MTFHILMLRWKLKTQWILVSTTITAHCGFYYLKNNWHFEKMSATVFHNCRSFHEKIVAIVRVLRYPSFFHNCYKFPVHNCDSREILTIVALLWWKIASFVTAWLFKMLLNWFVVNGSTENFQEVDNKQIDHYFYVPNLHFGSLTQSRYSFLFIS